MRKKIFFATVILGGILMVFITGAFMNGDKVYSIQQVRELLEVGDSVFVLDVRTPAEYDGELGHIPGSYLIPVQELNFRIDELEPHRDREIIVICRTDNRSRYAVSMLQDAGFINVGFVQGGMVAWNRSKN